MGKWKVVYSPDQYACYVVQDDHGHTIMATHDKRVADLAAAAPELLKACKALPLDGSEFNDAADFIDHAERFRNAMDLAWAAIRKATGEDIR